MTATDLQAPTLLISMPQVQDPFFQRSVVLLINHAEDGSFGFVVNRRTDLLVKSILAELEMEWGGAADTPALLGGPVQPQVGTILMPTSQLGGSSRALEIAPGLCVTQEVDSLREISLRPPTGLRLILGYSGWSPGQLEAEVERHDWLLCPLDAGLVFDPALDSMWHKALTHVGINPAVLPEWTQTSDSVN